MSDEQGNLTCVQKYVSCTPDIYCFTDYPICCSEMCCSSGKVCEDSICEDPLDLLVVWILLGVLGFILIAGVLICWRTRSWCFKKGEKPALENSESEVQPGIAEYRELSIIRDMNDGKQNGRVQNASTLSIVTRDLSQVSSNSKK